MCNAVAWPGHQIRFADPDARLPVLTRDNQLIMLPWGVHYDQSSHPYPKGACARLESVREGRWRWLNPRPVRIPVTSFSERSRQDRCNYWFSVPEGMALQGLFVPPGHLDPEGRVFVVTVALDVAMGYSLQPLYPLPEGGMPVVHDRWPRLVELALQPNVPGR